MKNIQRFRHGGNLSRSTSMKTIIFFLCHFTDNVELEQLSEGLSQAQTIGIEKLCSCKGFSVK
jgi:hypothetical protein